MKNAFFRGHGLGNDYLVMDPKELTFKLTPGVIRTICDRNWGLGSDGILASVPPGGPISACASSIPTGARRKSPATASGFRPVSACDQEDHSHGIYN